jgi:hypothetical protein
MEGREQVKEPEGIDDSNARSSAVFAVACATIATRRPIDTASLLRIKLEP